MSQSMAELKIPQEVKRDIETVVSVLLQSFSGDISKIILFGSYATGKYQPDSDIDIAVALREMPAQKQRRLYKRAAETADTIKDADILFCSEEQLQSGVFVYKRINEEGVTLYEQL